MSQPSRPLIQVLAEMPDPRQARGKWCTSWLSTAVTRPTRICYVPTAPIGARVSGIRMLRQPLPSMARAAIGKHWWRLKSLPIINRLLNAESTRICHNYSHQASLGRTAHDNPGLMRFKRHMGAIMEPLPYYPWTEGDVNEGPRLGNAPHDS